MSGDPFPEQAAKLFTPLDFSEEPTAREARHWRAQVAFFQSLLDVMDSFDRVLAESDAAVPLRTVELLARQLARCLERAGVTPLHCLGETADPEVHEIAEARPAERIGRDTIVEVVSGGYLWNGRLLRRPRVIVAAGEKERE
jgi:molecular chaperone GrpE (heat shock protein)